MLLAINKDEAKKTLDKYYGSLKVFGYVKRPIVQRILIWLFLVDFVERVYMLLTNKDYNMINKVLVCLFGNNDCIMRYKPEARKFIYGENNLYRAFKLRTTEADKWRIVETGDDLRSTESNTPLEYD